MTYSNPFPGLRSFEPEEEHLFFGRETQVDELLARLERTRFLAVVGSSGSGKSSIVRSGVIPALHGGYMVGAGSSWRIAVLRPGDDPIANLTEALDAPEILGDDDTPPEIRRGLLGATLGRGSRGLAEAVRSARLPEWENLLLVVDQFEELFRFKRSIKKASSDEAAAFVKLLLAASASPEIRLYTVLTMRSDFLGNCVEFQGLPEAINQGLYLVPRMDREERRAAIGGPVAVAGAGIAPRLVTRLLNDVGDSMDQLPILQHALMRTWDHWQTHHGEDEGLDLRHYEAVGTLAEALSLHAEEIYAELPSDRHRQCCEKLFKALTEKGEEGKGIRRPTPVAEVAALSGFELGEVIEVVEHFRAPGRSFLMPPVGVPIGPETILDISHESLMRVWKRLSQWVDDEAQAAQLYRRLARAAERHQAGRGGLWRGPDLQMALRWQEQNEPTAAWAERYHPAFERSMIFLELGREEREREVGRKERAQRRKLQRARRVAYGLGGLLLLALAAFLYAGIQTLEARSARQQAESERRIAEQQEQLAVRERELAEIARRQAETQRAKAEVAQDEALSQKERADRERLEALRQKEEAEIARRAAITAQLKAEEARTAAEEAEDQARVAQRQAEDNEERAETSEAKTRELRLVEVARRLAIQAQRLVEDGRAESAALAARQSWLFERKTLPGAQTSAEIDAALRRSLEALGEGGDQVLAEHDEAVRAAAWSPRGDRAATAGDDGQVRLFDPGDEGEGARELDRAFLTTPLRALTWSADGSRLALGGLDGSLYLFAAGDSLEPIGERRPAEGERAVTGLAFEPAGERLLVGRRGGEAELAALPGLDRQVILASGLGERVTAVAWGAEGLAAAGDEGEVRVWSGGGAEPRRLAAGAAVTSLAFSPDGRLAAGTRDGPILIWADPAAEPQRLLGHLSSVTALSFGSDGGLLLSSSVDQTLKLWDLGDDRTEPRTLAGHAGWVWDAELDPGASHVLSASADRSARVWDLETDHLAERVCEIVGRNLSREEWAELLPADLSYQETCGGEGGSPPPATNAANRPRRPSR